MNFDTLRELCAQNQCTCVENEPMSAHTSFHIGGPCKAFITVTTAFACAAILTYLRENQIKCRIIGKGCNLLVPDEGYDGVVLVLDGDFTDVTCDAPNGILTAGAGASIKSICLAAREASLTGLEFAYGIPGSIGGAIFMNAGAYDGEMSQVVHSVDYLNEKGVFSKLSADELKLSYRHSIFMEHPDWVILRAQYQLQSGDPDAIQAKMDDLMGRRKSKQPLEFPSAGSTFKRPEGSYASKLIDECGLKGLTVGGAQVSEKHAGFVINRGGASFGDVMSLCQQVREKVKLETGFILELEPEILC